MNKHPVALAIEQLAPHVGRWAGHNFDYHAPYMGVGEEVGELLHAKLKEAQGIRGTPEEHRAKIADAYADTCVFLSHLHWKLMSKEQMDNMDNREAYGHLFIAIGKLLCDPTDPYNLTRVVDCLITCAGLDGIDLHTEFMTTWGEVRMRDWRKFPKNGLTE